MWIIRVTASSSSQDMPDWNISRLDSILNAVEGECDDKIKAAQGPNLDFGMWKSAFAWHTEEMDLYSLSYMHYGEPRSWYVHTCMLVCSGKIWGFVSKLFIKDLQSSFCRF